MKSLNQKIVTGSDKLGLPVQLINYASYIINFRGGAQKFQVRGVLPQRGGTLTVGNFSLPVNDI